MIQAVQKLQQPYEQGALEAIPISVNWQSNIIVALQFSIR
ncbi:hypothetical protein SAMN05518872_1138 [Psychrobacillus sp. OK032]|nr:hypothetical protein SAMN05518872_1138 [Psychrobacillus sp. OK032]